MVNKYFQYLMQKRFNLPLETHISEHKKKYKIFDVEAEAVLDALITKFNQNKLKILIFLQLERYYLDNTRQITKTKEFRPFSQKIAFF